MFAQIFPSLMAHSRLSSLQLPPATGAHRTRIEADAQDALRQGSAHMRLSERLGNPAQWLMIQHRRRESLLALLLAGPSAALMPAIVDLIAGLCRKQFRGKPLDDLRHSQSFLRHTGLENVSGKHRPQCSGPRSGKDQSRIYR